MVALDTAMRWLPDGKKKENGRDFGEDFIERCSV